MIGSETHQIKAGLRAKSKMAFGEPVESSDETTTWYRVPPGSFGRGGNGFLGGATHIADHCAYLGHGQLVSAAQLGLGPNARKPVRFGGEGVHVVADAHDDDGRLTSAVHDESLVFGRGPAHDLAELRARGQC